MRCWAPRPTSPERWSRSTTFGDAARRECRNNCVTRQPGSSGSRSWSVRSVDEPRRGRPSTPKSRSPGDRWRQRTDSFVSMSWRSEEHTSELQSPCNLVCRLLLEKKKNGVLRMLGGKKKKRERDGTRW